MLVNSDKHQVQHFFDEFGSNSPFQHPSMPNGPQDTERITDFEGEIVSLQYPRSFPTQTTQWRKSHYQNVKLFRLIVNDVLWQCHLYL